MIQKYIIAIFPLDGSSLFMVIGNIILLIVWHGYSYLCKSVDTAVALHLKSVCFVLFPPLVGSKAIVNPAHDQVSAHELRLKMSRTCKNFAAYNLYLWLVVWADL